MLQSTKTLILNLFRPIKILKTTLEYSFKFFDNKRDFLKIFNLYIQTFDIKEIGHIDVNIHGLGPLDWILGTVVGFVADLIRDFLADVLEGPIKDLLQGILDDIMP